jgi:hypothetical protein
MDTASTEAIRFKGADAPDRCATRQADCILEHSRLFPRLECQGSRAFDHLCNERIGLGARHAVLHGCIGVDLDYEVNEGGAQPMPIPAATIRALGISSTTPTVEKRSIRP